MFVSYKRFNKVINKDSDMLLDLLRELVSNEKEKFLEPAML